MDFNNTRRRFKTRIELERAILSIVNKGQEGEDSLHGLSGAAIDVWKKTAVGKYPERVFENLSQLSNQLMIFCDNSKNSFDVEKRLNANAIRSEIDTFENYFESLK